LGVSVALYWLMHSSHARAGKIAPGATAPTNRHGNRLLAVMPGTEHRQQIVRCRQVDLFSGDVLSEQGEPISHVYLPIDSVIAQLSSTDERSGPAGCIHVHAVGHGLHAGFRRSAIG